MRAAMLAAIAAGAAAEDSRALCCCVQGPCGEGAAPGEDEAHTAARYVAERDLCCSWRLPLWLVPGCPAVVGWQSTGLVKMADELCSPPPGAAASRGDFAADIEHSEWDTSAAAERCAKAPAGTPEYAIANFCADSNAAGAGDLARAESARIKKAMAAKLSEELDRNSLKRTVEELMTVYVCVRWVPDDGFLKVVESEIAAGQLNASTAIEAVTNRLVVPLRCTQNVGVYDAAPSDVANAAVNNTRFSWFEHRMGALAAWLGDEAGGAMEQRSGLVDDDVAVLQQSGWARRVRDIAGSLSDAVASWGSASGRSAGGDAGAASALERLQQRLAAFDGPAVRMRAAGCAPGDEDGAVRDSTVTGDPLTTSDCGLTRWWDAKLRTWQRRFPYPSFLAPGESAHGALPGRGERFLVCFGKRVASSLHRRPGGEFLMTDMNTIGCHGFWGTEQAGRMLQGMVRLWRPPTCQLAQLELQMKRALMRLFVQMNENLFDALPGLLLDEALDGAPEDVIPSEARGAGIVSGYAKFLASKFAGAFSSIKGTYQRLGQLLGDSVVKWVVCPVTGGLKPADHKRLDASLGDEDDFYRRNAKAAYSHFTGDQAALPGAVCNAPAGGKGEELKGDGCKVCDTYLLEADFVMPVWDAEGKEDFICPIDTMLDSPELLKVVQQKFESDGFCVMRMTAEQMVTHDWRYRGRTPHLRQHDRKLNAPGPDYELVRVMRQFDRPDTGGTMRSWARVGRRCTIAERRAYPRWCSPPTLLQPESALARAWGAASEALGVTTAVLRRGVDAIRLLADMEQQGGRNRALKQQAMVMGRGLLNGIRGLAQSAVSAGPRRRYEALRRKMFNDTTANELVHSASFQASAGNSRHTSHSKDRYQRYLVACPCKGFDPERELEQQFATGELAVALARVGRDMLASAPHGTVSARAMASFNLHSANSTWLDFTAAARVADGGWAAQSGLINYVDDMQGRSAMGEFDPGRLHGVSASFACGRKSDLYDKRWLPSGSSFLGCLETGATMNSQLRAAGPDRVHFDGKDYAVRVLFAPLQDGRCRCTSAPLQPLLSADPALSENPLAAQFLAACGSSGECVADPKLGQEYGPGADSPTFGGVAAGASAPHDVLDEVLLDPAELLRELR
eukprot:TRINITY_DN37104_c0_g1_i1.p1 TRINITY_DN37104_c0_g1~~TRINITY_DN37104_c0_g1_i1.p1  ORF type:complete len:1160 (+),score=391.44 TRINITY_DN37104_c0_g1_i1:80-3481(+)